MGKIVVPSAISFGDAPLFLATNFLFRDNDMSWIIVDEFF